MDIREEIRVHTEEVEQMVMKYLPEEENYQKTIMEAMNYSMMAGGIQGCYR